MGLREPLAALYCASLEGWDGEGEEYRTESAVYRPPTDPYQETLPDCLYHRTLHQLAPWPSL